MSSLSVRELHVLDSSVVVGDGEMWPFDSLTGDFLTALGPTLPVCLRAG